MSGRVPEFLTKSHYSQGLTCRKWLWLAFNQPDRLTGADEKDLHRFNEGHRIGELARQRFPGGILIEEKDPKANLQRSQELVRERVPLFEAGFLHPDGKSYAKADVLRPVGKDQWDLVEVKSSGSVKDDHLHDVAFQLRCYTGAGLKVRKCSLLLVNTAYVRSGDVDVSALFQEVDVTAGVNALTPKVPGYVKDLLDIIGRETCPEFGKGDPFHKDDLGFHEDDSLWSEHPGSDILDLYRGGQKKLDFLESGIYKIQDIPQGDLNAKQTLQQEAHLAGKPRVDPKKIAAFLAKLEYPLHFLDFETFQTVVPLFDGVRPYQQVPFQYSLHVVEKPGERPRHHSYLSLAAEDPRSGFAAALWKDLGPRGHIIAWNISFEKGRLKELAAFLPEHTAWTQLADGRFVDLMQPFADFAYYHPRQGGSVSLKAVLPALTGVDYQGLEISDGGMASLAYLQTAWGAEFGSRSADSEAKSTQLALEKYCGQDTEGMVLILEKLEQLAAKAKG